MRLSVHLSLTFWPTKLTWYRQMIPHFPSSNFPIIDDSHNNFYASNIHGKFSAYYPNRRKTLISEEWSCFKRPKWPQTNWYIRKEIFCLSCSWPFTTSSHWLNSTMYAPFNLLTNQSSLGMITSLAAIFLSLMTAITLFMPRTFMENFLDITPTEWMKTLFF